eukprot:903371-Prorocentrum_minimum.AAC.2
MWLVWTTRMRGRVRKKVEQRSPRRRLAGRTSLWRSFFQRGLPCGKSRPGARRCAEVGRALRGAASSASLPQLEAVDALDFGVLQQRPYTPVTSMPRVSP